MSDDHPGEKVIWRDDYHQVFERFIGMSQQDLEKWLNNEVQELDNKEIEITSESDGKRYNEWGDFEKYVSVELDVYKIYFAMNPTSEKHPYPSLYFRSTWDRPSPDIDPEEIPSYKALPRRQHRCRNGLDLGWIEFRRINDLTTQVVGYSINEYSEKFDDNLFEVENKLKKLEDALKAGSNNKNETEEIILQAENSPGISNHQDVTMPDTASEVDNNTKQTPTDKQDPCDSLLPQSDKARKRWRRAYSIYCKRKREYLEEVLDDKSKNVTVTLADFQAAIVSEMKWRVSERTLRKIIKAGEKDCLKRP